MSYQQRLIFDLYGAGLAGDNRHAQVAMRELGITYQVAVPQSMGDQWQFWNCEHVPDELPDYVRVAEPTDPYKHVGYGLSKEMAEKIAHYSPSQ